MTDLDLLECLLGRQIGDAAHLGVDPGFHRSARVSVLLPESDGVLVPGAQGPELGPRILPGLDRLIDDRVDSLAHLGGARLAQRFGRCSELAYQHLSLHEFSIQALKFHNFHTRSYFKSCREFIGEYC